MSEETRAIVIDITDSSLIKAGFAGDDAPRVVFPNVIGVPGNQQVMVGGSDKEFYVGNEALEKSSILKLTYPVERGVIVDWENFTRVLHHTFHNELRVNPEDYSVLITESPLNPKINQEKLCQILFESFSVPAMYISNEAIAALYSSGRTTGLVLNITNGATYAVPIYDGYLVPSAVTRLNIGKRDLVQYLSELLTQSGHSLTTLAEQEIVADILDKAGYVALDYDREIEGGKSEGCTYELPDGTTLTIKSERFRATEALFQPSLMGIEGIGIDEAIYQSIENGDVYIRKDLYSNILLVGEGSMLPGLVERLTKELTALVSPDFTVPDVTVKIIAPPERKHSVWIGCSVLSSLSTFDSMWLRKYEYDVNDPSIIYTKFS